MLALLVLLPGFASAELPATVAQALKQAGIPESHVGVLVQDVDNPLPLLAHGEKRSLNPASVMKLVTTLAALDSLGPAHTFKTRMLVDGPIKEGVLQGNLILQGGGDPALTLERFWLLLRELRERGVREIRGDVVLDASYYHLDPIDPAAFDQAPLRPYNAPPSALLVNFNTLNLRLGVTGSVAPNGISARLDPAPADAPSSLYAPPDLVNQLQLTDTSCSGWREKLTPQRDNGSLILTGAYPSACGDQSLPLNLLSPEATVAATFSALWKELGNLHSGKIRTGASETNARLLFEFESPPLAQLVRDINKYSNNVMAKMLFLNLGAARYEAPATWEKSVRAVRNWATEHGLELPKLVLENGSGLSRIERISAASLAHLLSYAAARPAYYEFAASLPAVGLEGTQKNRMNGSAAAGLAWLKSGTLHGARNLAGYVLGPNGRRRILVMLINHANAAAGAKAQAALVEWSLK
ncbi:MAG: D-alanyl-D-alanine carboxypeptidase/D-alanyl-D-alanine-endopeptidase [Pseudomonadota bacterium]|nr:D-alanyl-D-alanine carboxypeptidase/D-alanyl-D-alanine-endopeptidase [Pseudomonadota bacterium]